MNDERKCKECGADISGRDSCARFCVDCAKKRRDESYKRARARYRKNGRIGGKTRVCEQCGEELPEDANVHVRFCPECVSERRKKYFHELYVRKHPNAVSRTKKKPVTTGTCNYCGRFDRLHDDGCCGSCHASGLNDLWTNFGKTNGWNKKKGAK